MGGANRSVLRMAGKVGMVENSTLIICYSINWVGKTDTIYSVPATSWYASYPV